jgi:hypothetical protein
MTFTKLSSLLTLVIAALFVNTPLRADTKVGCKSVAATEAACTEYASDTKACTDLVQAEVTKKIDAAKAEQDNCKKKNGAAYMLKCTNEIKSVTTLVHTPKPVMNHNVEKEQTAVAGTPCAKAAALGKDNPLCKGPKKAIEVMKANCIKDL